MERFAAFLIRRGDRGVSRLFTASEREYCRSHSDPTHFFAARFAAKEAFYKALGTGIGPSGSWHDVEVVRLSSGRPLLMLHGRAAAHAHDLQVRTIHLSLTHTAEIAGAFVILEG